LLEQILAADVGSAMTKVVLFRKEPSGWHIAGHAIAPTTVETSESNVMSGLHDALLKLESCTGQKLLAGSQLITPCENGLGVDLFLVTSSAGGGLQVLVAGLTREITAESAHRAALGAGAVVSEVVCLDDVRMGLEAVERLGKSRPDMVLITGGTDGGNDSSVTAVAELLAMANPKPRFGNIKLPAVYAGNIDARNKISEILADSMEVTYVDNVRPSLERETLESARAEIHRIFLEYVVKRTPGYDTLSRWAKGHVKATPLAFGDILSHIARQKNHDVLAADVGGATTDVFSVVDGKLCRTVSANLDISHSTSNLLYQVRPDSILRWLPVDIDEDTLRNWNFNKMLRPTTLPQTFRELMLEQAFVREALRISLAHHCSLARELKGVHKAREVGDIFNQDSTGKTLVNPMKIGTMIGSGGAISHAPRFSQAGMMLLDGLTPEGITDIFVDQKLLLPLLGLLLDVEKNIAEELLEGECLTPLGTSICPVGPKVAPGIPVAKVRFQGESIDVVSGEIQVVSLKSEDRVMVEVIPKRNFDVGAGKSTRVVTTVLPGTLGLILDGRGRPLVLPPSHKDRKALLRRWYRALNVYPDNLLSAAMKIKSAD